MNEPTQEDMIDYLAQLENQGAHHAARDSAEWLEYQGVADALGLTPDIWNEDGDKWNDTTQKYEKIIESDRTKAHGMVQRRIRAAEFRREYWAYRTDLQHRDVTGRLPGGVHDITDDPAVDVGR